VSKKTEKSKRFLELALRELPPSNSLGNVRSHIHRALTEIVSVNKKEAKKLLKRSIKRVKHDNDK